MIEESRKIRVSVIPKPPKTVEETGLTLGFLVELSCKTLYFGGVMTLSSISEKLALPVSVANDVMEFLKKERLAEVKKGGDIPATYTYALTDLGRERAREHLQLPGWRPSSSCRSLSRSTSAAIPSRFCGRSSARPCSWRSFT